MSKLVLFLFFAVCVVAVQMQPLDLVDDEAFEDLLDALTPRIESELNYNSRIKIPVKKIWQVAKPILKEAAKEAAKAGGAALVGGRQRFRVPVKELWGKAKPHLKEAAKEAAKAAAESIVSGRH